MRVVEITTEADFQRLKEPWNDLALATSSPVFLRHEWFEAAWAWRRCHAALGILCVFSDDRLVGVLPLLGPQRSAYGSRHLRFLTVPDTQSCDLLVDPASTTDVCHALVAHLVAVSGQWDSLHLERLAPRSVVETSLMPGLIQEGVHCELNPVDYNMFVDLKDVWSNYYISRSRRLKKAGNLAANRLARVGKSQLESLGREMKRDDLEKILADVTNVSARSWKRQTGNSLDMPGPQAFIQKLTDLAFAQGWLSIWILRLRDEPIAMEYQLVYKGVVHALRGDFDEGYRKFSPGTYLNWRLLEGLFAGGLDRYYLGPGKNLYKKRWSDSGETLHTFICYSPTGLGRVWRGLAALRTKFRALSNSERPV